MSKIRFEHRDLTLLPNPPTGATLLAYDSDGMLKQKDSAGVISKIGGGDLLIEREITKAELLTAYSSPIVIIPDPGDNKYITINKFSFVEDFTVAYDYEGLGEYNFMIQDVKRHNMQIFDMDRSFVNKPTFNYFDHMKYEDRYGYEKNGDVVVFGQAGGDNPNYDPDSGEGTIRLIIWYQILDHSFLPMV